jgi:ribonuclease E
MRNRFSKVNMKKKILINAHYPEEKRVAIIEDGTLVDFYVEVASREHLKGNIYKGVIARVEPGIQAAFVDFGYRKQGFIQAKEISPGSFRRKKETRGKRIQDIVTKGAEILVQVDKDERGTKGPSLTTFISLPGRYIVMMPGRNRVGISRKIEDRSDRNRLKEAFSKLKLPKSTGFILRTACSDLTGEELSNDLKYLTKLWSQIQAEAKKVSAPAMIYKEYDIAVRTVRDYLTADVNEVLIDDKETHKNTRAFLKKTVPWLKVNVKYYREKRPLFSKYNIEDQIAKISGKYVHLPSKGYLVIESTEALTVIDVNSGRSRKEEHVESTAFKTNLEAADAIARHLRLRDIGGLITIDFIDMSLSKNRREVETAFEKALSSDKARTEITAISKFGILEMSRERMRPAYLESMSRNCEACGGTGVVRPEESVAVSVLRDIRRRASKGGMKSITCRMTVGISNYLINEKRNEIAAIENEFEIVIKVIGEENLPNGRFEIEEEQDKSDQQTHKK